MTKSVVEAGTRKGVVIVDDEPLVLRALGRILSPCGYEIQLTSRTEALSAWIHDRGLAVVLLDLFVGDVSGMNCLASLREARPDVEVVVMTGRGSIDSAVACMRAGAFDYLCKPFADIQRVRATVADARAVAIGQVGEVGLPPGDPGPTGRTTDWLRVPLVAPHPAPEEVPLSLEAYERLALERALREASGDAAEAARRLGIGRSTFYRRAAKVGVNWRRIDEEPSSERRFDPPRVGGRPPIG